MAFSFRAFGKEIFSVGNTEAQSKSVKRSFGDTEESRLYADFNLDYGYNPRDTANELPKMRGRSRKLCKDDPFAKKWLWLLVTNIIGEDGFTLQVKSKDPNGNLDTKANDELEKAFARWAGNAEWVDMAAKKTWVEMQQASLKATARDGESIIRMIDAADNPHGFALKMYRPDALDLRLNQERTPRGTYIHNGIEYNSWGRPLKYWLKANQQNTYITNDSYTDRHVAIDARNIIHPFLEEEEEQTRGFPWLYTAIRRLWMLDQYEHAELEAARDCANSLGIYKKRPEAYSAAGGPEASRKDLEESIRPSAPGAREVLPEGWEYEENNAVRPNDKFPDFRKAMLRGIAAGGLVSYNTLADDLEGVSYSSLRDGKLTERDMYRVIQNVYKNKVNRVIYLRWLLNYLSWGPTNLPLWKYEKFSAHEWQGRRWQWVDPANETKAKKMQRDYGWKTDQKIAQEIGEDFGANLVEMKETKSQVKGIHLEDNYVPQSKSQKQ